MPNNEGVPPGAEQQPVPPERAPPQSSASGALPDQVTPHRITTIAFIIEFLYGKQARLTPQTREKDQMTPTERTRVSFLIVNLIQFPDENLLSTVRRLVAVVARPILAAWAKRMIAVEEKGIAGLMDLFQAVEKLIIDDMENMARKRSLVGMLLRRMFLQFDKMSFSEVSILKNRFSAYFSRGATALNMLLKEVKDESESDLEVSMEEYKLPSAVRKSFTDSVDQDDEDEVDCDEVKVVTRKQADLFIARQANLLQYSEGHALSPAKLQKELKIILRSNPGLSEAYFLSYLNSLRMNEFVGAVDSLFEASSNNINTAVKFDNSKLHMEDINKNFRYDELNLGSLHARLGHHTESLAAVKEAITIAQEAKDHECLQHALAWLTRVAPDNKGIPLLQRSVSKCEKLALPYLSSLGMLSLCGFVEEFGDKPAYVLDLLTRSAVLNCKHDLVELQCNAFLVRGNVWSTWGRPLMSQTVTQLLLQLNTSGNNRDGLNYQGEPILLGLLNTALSLEEEGYRSEADIILRTCERLYPCPVSQYSQVWKVAKQKILFSRHLLNGNWIKAESCLSVLSALPPSSSAPGQIKLLEAELLFRQGDFQTCRDVLKGILRAGEPGCDEAEEADQEQQQTPSSAETKETLVRSRILLSDILVMCNDPGTAVEHLIKAKELATRYRLESLHCLVCLHMANLQLGLGAAERALSLVRQCLTFLLAHGTKRERSRGLLLSSKCRVAANAERPELERRAELLEAAGQVGKAKEGFLELQDWDRVKDCLYLQARIYHSLLLTTERNMAAQQYKQFDELYPTVSPVHQLLLI